MGNRSSRARRVAVTEERHRWATAVDFDDAHEAFMGRITRQLKKAKTDLEELGIEANVAKRRRYLGLCLEQPSRALVGLGEHRFFLLGALDDANDFISCMDGAEQFVELYGTGEPLAETPTQGRNGENLRREPNPDQDALIARLQDAIQNDRSNGSFFRVHLAGHGFVLVVQNDKVSLFESLAHGEDAGMMLSSIRRATQMTRRQASDRLGGMIAPDYQTRVDAAGEMGWNAGPLALVDSSDESVPDRVAVWWTQHQMKDQAEIKATLDERLDRNRALLKVLLKDIAVGEDFEIDLRETVWEITDAEGDDVGMRDLVQGTRYRFRLEHPTERTQVANHIASVGAAAGPKLTLKKRAAFA